MGKNQSPHRIVQFEEGSYIYSSSESECVSEWPSKEEKSVMQHNEALASCQSDSAKGAHRQAGGKTAEEGTHHRYS